jgi:hypothetical protein
MPTIAQKKAEQAKMDKSARRIAYTTMGTMLTLSTAANVLTAWDYDIVSRVVAGIPPVSLFITSALYERMRSTLPIKIGMLLTILVSLAFSWVHISTLAYTHHQNLYISILLPVIIDVPMLFAGTIIINQRQPAPTPQPTKTAPTITKKATVTKARTTTKPTPKHATIPLTA